MIGVRIEVVEPGTVFFDPATGNPFEVTDKSTVTSGHTMYVTEKTFERMKKACSMSTTMVYTGPRAI